MIRMLAENPATLVEMGAPHRIHSDEALACYTKALFRLTAKDEPTDAEQETIDLLTLLVADYESRFQVPRAQPVDVLKYLVEKGGLRQQDLRNELGSLSNVSMILSGKRNLTLANASALAARFNLDIRVFLPAPAVKRARSRAARMQSDRATAKRTRVVAQMR